jgi:transcriptional regulator with GAF, ATPase, and Fis domain
MVRVNCAALPESLLESELFGYARGAFSGALADREGLFQVAHEGTLFLDEIGELPVSMQAKLLRVLQDGEFHRIGDPRRPVRVDVRVLAATNCDLEARVRRGEFRADLFYRLNVVPLRLPPLRERRADIPALIERFLARSAPGRGRHFSPEACAALTAHEWPGNVRELANAVAYAVVLGDGPELGLADLPFVGSGRSIGMMAATAPVVGDSTTLEETEVHCILQALGRTSMNRTRAAQLLGITRRTLGYRIRKYRLEDLIQQATGVASARSMAKTGPGRTEAAIRMRGA